MKPYLKGFICGSINSTMFIILTLFIGLGKIQALCICMVFIVVCELFINTEKKIHERIDL